MKTHSLTAKITVRKDKRNKQGYAPVVLQLSSGKQLSRIPLGFTIKEIDFDFENQAVLNSHNEHKRYNQTIDSSKKRMENTYVHYQEIINEIFDCSPVEIFRTLYNSDLENVESVKTDLLKQYGLQLIFTERVTRMPKASLNMRVPIDKWQQTRNLVVRFLKGEQDDQIGNLLNQPDDHALEEKNDVFNTAWSQYKKYCVLEKKESTASKVQNNYDIVCRFCIKYNIPLDFDAFTEEFGSTFKHYLLKEHFNINSNHKGVSDGTVHNIQKSISAFLNWSFKKGYNTSIDFKKWNTTKPQTHLQYLTSNQLYELYELQLDIGSSYDKTRDLWCFAAFSGMRKSDVDNWIPSNVSDDVIKYKSIKTRKDCIVPLNKFTRNILNKYNGGLPKQNDSLVNKNIKDILKKLKYDQIMVNRTLSYGKEDRVTVISLADAITFHSARRSFINFMISNKVTIAHLSSMVGNDVKSLMIYYKTDVSELKKAMKGIKFPVTKHPAVPS